MPEYPDIEVYIECLRPRTLHQPVRRVRLFSPFVLRTYDPAIESIQGLRARAISRLGKRIVWHFDGELSLVLHLMIAGRLLWKPAGAKPPGKIGLAALDFDHGTLMLTEAASKKRASIHLVRGEAELRRHDPGGLEPIDSRIDDFVAALTRENRTVKRALTDPRILSGIGNSYSDEILHAARLSPLALTRKLTPEQLVTLHAAVNSTLLTWRERLRAEAGEEFPEKVTAFRPEMAVHGKFGRPCPVCAAPVQRIRYADNETNYCPGCQTGGKVLADRSLSKLLKDDWPRTLEELEDWPPRGGLNPGRSA